MRRACRQDLIEQYEKPNLTRLLHEGILTDGR